MAALCLRFCARAFSICGKRGPLLIAVRGPLTIAASLATEHRLQTRRLSNCGSRAQLLRGMWDLPGSGLEPVSPALAGRFSTTAPPGKPRLASFTYHNAFEILPCCCVGQYVIFLFIAEEYSIIWRYHNLFIYSPVEGHLPCVQFLAVNK